MFEFTDPSLVDGSTIASLAYVTDGTSVADHVSPIAGCLSLAKHIYVVAVHNMQTRLMNSLLERV